MANLDLFRSRDTNDTPPLTPGQRASKRARYHHTSKDTAAPPDTAFGGATTSSSLSIAKELADAKRMVQAFDAIDSSITESREKLKIFYKTADETNTLLDMWIRLLSQTEHTLNLLQDPNWEGKTMEEIQAREALEKRSALEEAIRRETMSSRAIFHSSQSNNYTGGAGTTGISGHGLQSSSTSAPNTIAASRQGNLGSSTTAPLPSSPYNTTQINNTGSFRRSQLASSLSGRSSKSSAAAILAAAHAHASAIADNRKRPEGSAGQLTGRPARLGGEGASVSAVVGSRSTARQS